MTDLNNKLPPAWEGFTAGDWQKEVNVRDFIQKNYTPYEGDEAFLAGASAATTSLWEKVIEGIKTENRTHASVDFDTDVAATITSHDTGYINKKNWKRSSACKPMRRLNAPLFRSAASKWWKTPAKRTIASWNQA